MFFYLANSEKLGYLGLVALLLVLYGNNNSQYLSCHYWLKLQFNTDVG
jgi:hypothetical protein